MYTVKNICGGTVYRGRSLQQAANAALSWGSEPYVVSARGRRRVYRDPDGYQDARKLPGIDGDYFRLGEYQD